MSEMSDAMDNGMPPQENSPTDLNLNAGAPVQGKPVEVDAGAGMDVDQETTAVPPQEDGNGVVATGTTEEGPDAEMKDATSYDHAPADVEMATTEPAPDATAPPSFPSSPALPTATVEPGAKEDADTVTDTTAQSEAPTKDGAVGPHGVEQGPMAHSDPQPGPRPAMAMNGETMSTEQQSVETQQQQHVADEEEEVEVEVEAGTVATELEVGESMDVDVRSGVEGEVEEEQEEQQRQHPPQLQEPTTEAMDEAGSMEQMDHREQEAPPPPADEDVVMDDGDDDAATTEHGSGGTADGEEYEGVCLRGTTRSMKDGSMRMEGYWALKRDHFGAGNNKLMSKFEYSMLEGDTGYPPRFGYFKGFFFLRRDGKSQTKVNETALTFKFTPLGADGEGSKKYEVYATGRNKYGTFRMNGFAEAKDGTKNLKFELFRTYEPVPLTMRATHPVVDKKKGVAKPSLAPVAANPMKAGARTAGTTDAPKPSLKRPRTSSGAEARPQRGADRSAAAPAAATALPTTAEVDRPCMHGEMYRGEQGTITISGRWALSLREIRDPKLCSKFEYKIKSFDDHRSLPLDGEYDGFFLMKRPHGKSEKIKEKGLQMKFKATRDGQYEIRASGRNPFGAFNMTGSAKAMPGSEKVSIEIFREYAAVPTTPAPATTAPKARASSQQTPASQQAQRHHHGNGTSADGGKEGAGRKRRTPVKFAEAQSSSPPAPPRTAEAGIPKDVKAKLAAILRHLKGKAEAYYFMVPVDPVALQIPDYFSVIKHPMDIGTVETKLNAGEYMTEEAFAKDVRLIFSNAVTYNVQPGSQVRVAATKLEKVFEAKFGDFRAWKDQREATEAQKRQAAEEEAQRAQKAKEQKQAALDAKKAKAREKEEAKERERRAKIAKQQAAKEQKQAAAKAAKQPKQPKQTKPPKAVPEPSKSKSTKPPKGYPADDDAFRSQQYQEMIAMQKKMVELQETILALQTQTTTQSLRMQIATQPNSKAKKQAIQGLMAESNEATDKVMSNIPLEEAEKDALTRNIERLPPNKLNKVMEIIQSQMELSGFHEDDIEIDLDTLPTATQRKLQKYVQGCFPKKKAPGGSKGGTKSKAKGTGAKPAASKKRKATAESGSPAKATAQRGGTETKASAPPAKRAKTQGGSKASQQKKAATQLPQGTNYASAGPGTVGSSMPWGQHDDIQGADTSDSEDEGLEFKPMAQPTSAPTSAPKAAMAASAPPSQAEVSSAKVEVLAQNQDDEDIDLQNVSAWSGWDTVEDSTGDVNVGRQRSESMDDTDNWSQLQSTVMEQEQRERDRKAEEARLQEELRLKAEREQAMALEEAQRIHQEKEAAERAAKQREKKAKEAEQRRLEEAREQERLEREAVDGDGVHDSKAAHDEFADFMNAYT